MNFNMFSNTGEISTTQNCQCCQGTFENKLVEFDCDNGDKVTKSLPISVSSCACSQCGG
jgi:hypothetical protein